MSLTSRNEGRACVWSAGRPLAYEMAMLLESVSCSRGWDIDSEEGVWWGRSARLALGRYSHGKHQDASQTETAKYIIEEADLRLGHTIQITIATRGIGSLAGKKGSR